jgi:glc operon protein GlcG
MASALGLKEAQRLLNIAVEESERRGVKTAVAIVDARGDMIVAARLDGARYYYPDVAYGKAMASAMWEADSSTLSRGTGTNTVQQRVNAMNGGRMVFAGGAVVLRRDDVIIGAIGVGGSGPVSDEEIAKVAAAALDA